MGMRLGIAIANGKEVGIPTSSWFRWRGEALLVRPKRPDEKSTNGTQMVIRIFNFGEKILRS
jgi:hypothetical protein